MQRTRGDIYRSRRMAKRLDRAKGWIWNGMYKIKVTDFSRI